MALELDRVLHVDKPRVRRAGAETRLVHGKLALVAHLLDDEPTRAGGVDERSWICALCLCQRQLVGVLSKEVDLVEDGGGVGGVVVAAIIGARLWIVTPIMRQIKVDGTREPCGMRCIRLRTRKLALVLHQYVVRAARRAGACGAAELAVDAHLRDGLFKRLDLERMVQLKEDELLVCVIAHVFARALVVVVVVVRKRVVLVREEPAGEHLSVRAAHSNTKKKFTARVLETHFKNIVANKTRLVRLHRLHTAGARSEDRGLTRARCARWLMIEVICNDRLGKKVRVKCNPEDTIGDLKKLLAAQIGTRPEKLRIQKWYTVYKDHITLEDYEIHDGMGLELYYN